MISQFYTSLCFTTFSLHISLTGKINIDKKIYFQLSIIIKHSVRRPVIDQGPVIDQLVVIGY